MIPNLEEAQSVPITVSTMSMVVYKNKVMGNLEYKYETHYLKPLHLESPDHRIHSELCVVPNGDCVVPNEN